MRTNIDIDDLLLKDAMAAAGLTSKKATVEEALRRLVLEHRRREAVADMAGLGWTGDLDATSLDRCRQLRLDRASQRHRKRACS